MPIYAYRCAACGHQKDVLQKLSDAPLSTCPACGQPAFSKQVTAPAFQLKGTGWYVTDFRDGSKGKAGDGKADADKATDKGAEKPADKAPDKAADGAKSDGAAKGADAGASSTPASGGSAGSSSTGGTPAAGGSAPAA